MKLAMWALVVVGVYFLYEFFVGSVFKEYKSCYDATTIEIQYQNDPTVSSCVSQKLEFDSMLQCVEEVKMENNFVSFLYEASPAKKSIENDINAHNAACRTNKVELPKGSFYMSASEAAKR